MDTRGRGTGRGVPGRGADAASQPRELSRSEDGGVGRGEPLAHLKIAFDVHTAGDAEPLCQQHRHVLRVGARRFGLEHGRLDRARIVCARGLVIGDSGSRRRSSLGFLSGRHTGCGGRVLLSAGRGAALLRGVGAGRPGVPCAARRLPKLPGGAGERPVDHVQQRPHRQPDGHILDRVGEHDIGAVRWHPPVQRHRRSGSRRSGPVAGASD